MVLFCNTTASMQCHWLQWTRLWKCVIVFGLVGWVLTWTLRQVVLAWGYVSHYSEIMPQGIRIWPIFYSISTPGSVIAHLLSHCQRAQLNITSVPQWAIGTCLRATRKLPKGIWIWPEGILVLSKIASGHLKIARGPFSGSSLILLRAIW